MTALAGFVVLLALLLGGAAAFLTQTDAGRRQVAIRLERALTAAIPGSITIGALDRLEPKRAVLRDLRFLHPDGSVVLRADRAEIAFAPLDLVRGRVLMERARVDGGTLLIAVQPDGRTTIESVFDAPGPGTGDGAQIRLRSIHVEDLDLILRPAQDQTFRLRGVEGFVAVESDGRSGAKVRMERISARVVEPKVLGEQADILRADGWVHGGARQVLGLDVQAALEGDRFDATVSYYDRDKEKVVLELAPKEGMKTELAALGAELQSWISEDVDVERK